MSDQRTKKPNDGTVALINIVFLMLIFFLIAGTIVPPIDKQINPISSQIEGNAELENSLSIRQDGTTYFLQEPTSPTEFMATRLQDEQEEDKTVRVLADQELAATTLVEVVNELKAAGASSVLIVTEKNEQ
ncbi:MAG: biopolymer transporter ExbD [Pseudomonadota bacterium]